MNETRKFGVIFDMDGVIVDSNPVHKIAITQFLDKYGIEFSEEKLTTKVWGRQNKDWIPSVFNQSLDLKLIKEYGDEKEKLYRELFEKDIKPLPGLEKFLQTLKESKIPIAIGTSAPIENVTFTLGKTGLSKYFETVIDESHVEIGKPHPDVYIKASKALNFSPSDCIVFEDSLAGVESGKRAGCKVVGVLTTLTKEELKETDFTIRDFTEINMDDLVRIIERK